MEMLRGRVAVVTGGASGIGRAMAERFLDEGMSVALGDVEQAALDATVKALGTKGDVLAVVTDVSDAKSVDSFAAQVKDRFGSYDVVCNNAGVAGHLGLLGDTPLEDWRWVLDVNLMGVVHGIRSFVPGLVDQGSGHVVNTASVAGWLGVPGMGPYCASKHAVLAISEVLRNELQASHSSVGVSVLCPGTVNTAIMKSERNWPDRLGQRPEASDDPLTRALRERLVAESTGGGVAPERAASAVVTAIKANQFVVTTDPDNVVKAAQSRLAAARNAATP
jgi:NAD(P)-dependent dehydrogenase (short-subunit alcohol dehydrogenase family)